jgi:hypothetical protein
LAHRVRFPEPVVLELPQDALVGLAHERDAAADGLLLSRERLELLLDDLAPVAGLRRVLNLDSSWAACSSSAMRLSSCLCSTWRRRNSSTSFSRVTTLNVMVSL